jgi:hypothetical protein
MVLNVVKIQDTENGKKSVADDLEAVLRKIENWHQGSIAGYGIIYLAVWTILRVTYFQLPTRARSKRNRTPESISSFTARAAWQAISTCSSVASFGTTTGRTELPGPSRKKSQVSFPVLGFFPAMGMTSPYFFSI